MLFDEAGHYLEDFMHFGKGPNEFFEITSLDCNSNHEILILRNGQFIDIMSFDRIVNNTIKLANTTPKTAKWLTNDIIVLFYPFPRYLTNGGYEICFIDRNGKILKKALKRVTKGVEYGVGSGIIRTGITNNEMYYWYRYSDTVYTINSSMHVTPRLAFAHDERNIPYQEIIKNSMIGKNDDKKYKVRIYDEWLDFKFITLLYDRHYVRGIINEEQGIFGNSLYSYDPIIYKYVYSGILNNIDGGFPFWPTKMMRDGSAISILDPFFLQETINFNEKKKFPMDLSLHKKLKNEIISGLNMYSNPIIMRVSK